MLIDTHCHLFKQDYSNVEEVINHMNKNIMIVSADNLKTSYEVCKLIAKYDNVYGTIGIHPTELDEYKIDNLNEIESMILTKGIVGIGEIGLDYHYENTDKDLQKEVFISQLDLARKYKLPVVIHSRDAFNDTLEILKNYTDLKIDLHCYGYSLEAAKQFLKINPNIRFGIGGVLTFKNSRVIKEVVSELDLKYFVLETDSPYLSPEPYRGKQNEPYNVIYVAKYMAELKETSLDEIAKITSENAIKLFDLNMKK